MRKCFVRNASLVIVGTWSVTTIFAGVVTAQSPQADADAHVAVARAAAGMDFRNTFLNLCVPAAAGPAGGRAGSGAARGAAPTVGAAAAPAARGGGGGGRGQTPDRAGW